MFGENNKKSKSIYEWYILKNEIQQNTKKKEFYFQEKDVWWASLGVNIGHEEDGKNGKFERPVLILKKFNNYLLLIVPLSSKIKVYNKYYYKLILNHQYSSVIISQVRAISNKRLIRKIGKIKNEDFKIIKKMIKSYL